MKGFLHWGLNFYNTQYSKKHINPFEVTDAGGFAYVNGTKTKTTPAVDYKSVKLYAKEAATGKYVAVVTEKNEQPAITAGKVVSDASVKNIAEGSEVTYYVSAGEEIVYINQETAGESGVTFPEFTAAWNKLTASTVVFGSDADWNEGGFRFVNAGNYMSSGSANAVADDAWDVEGTEEGADKGGANLSGVSFTAKVSGKYSEYGIRVTINEETVELPALGCSEDGTYTVFVGGVTAAEIDAVPYAR